MNYIPTDEDVAFYQENGYWISPKLFSDEEVALFREHHLRVIQGEYETNRPPLSRSQPPEAPLDSLIKIDNSYYCDAHLAQLVLSARIGHIAARLSQSKGIRLWHDQLLYKPPQNETATAVGWHQDHHYWQCAEPAELLTAWIALCDVTEENGCMEVVPKSHKWGLVEGSDFFSQDLETLQHNIEASTGKKMETVSCPLPAGAVSFHHCRTVHGSRPNMSDQPRISMVAHLQPDGTYYKANTNSEGHSNVRLLSGKDGDAYNNYYFPMLWQE
jgi:ectoine hydroxylase-related dioxygenase (phytanoyl-CoA dioxygenase family)